MSDEAPRVAHLYECYAARANADLSECRIFHSELIAWDDEDALARFRAQAGAGYVDVDVRRIMDVRV